MNEITGHGKPGRNGVYTLPRRPSRLSLRKAASGSERFGEAQEDWEKLMEKFPPVVAVEILARVLDKAAAKAASQQRRTRARTIADVIP
jgi:hypothetical protein